MEDKTKKIDYIKLNDEVNLFLEPIGNSKLKYVFRRNGNEICDYEGLKPSSLTTRSILGKEIIKHLNYKSNLSQEAVNGLFDKTKEKSQLLFEKNKKNFNESKSFKSFESLKKELINLLDERKNINKSHRILGELLGEYGGIILSKDSHLIYKLDKKSNGYVNLSFDEVKKIAADYVGDYNTNDNDIKIALSHIDKRLTPKHNIVKFDNCLYDMDKLSIVEYEEPVFTVIESKFNYNSNANAGLIKEFLHTSLKRDSIEETEKEVQKVLEIIGYLFTSGNKRTILPIITGIGGSGKSVLLNIITKIFGVNKTTDLKLQDMNTPHGTSALLGKHLNIIRDSDDGIVENIAILKQQTGYDDLQVNPKFKNPILIDKDEVPKSILVANKIPRFKNLDSALMDRIIIIEFKHKFRGTLDENKDLLADILNIPEEIEWLIYNSIESYKKMVFNDKDFLAKESFEKTELILNKHTMPLNFLVSELVSDNSSDTRISTDIIYTDELNRLCIKLAKKEGLDITSYMSKGKIKPVPLLNAIRGVFGFWDSRYSTNVSNIDNTSKRFYPDIYKIINKWNELSDE
ncbi:hypothetical protein SDC9_21209 [bioreactor metagenome]|uniref:SF3 helicase domain-containing protein n=1 Tax=bioreactor metagenome TaxID=1076179 RepID=A0A644U8V6_9ZZZZ|nr:DUF5906 domain-containing protein [Methanobrevibacter sp.]MEA4957997.1 DUF5906 domain-containing protein [Methanobrevibacter sp.]